MADNGKKDTLDEKVNETVAALDPEQLAKWVVVPHRKARGKWVIENPQITDYGKFREHVAGYVKHHFKSIYKGELSDEEASGQAHQILEAAFQRQGGFEHAFDLSREGKLDEVVNALSTYFETQASERYVTHHITTLDPKDLEGRSKVVEKVYEKYRSILPKGTKPRKAEFDARDLPGVISRYVNAAHSAATSVGEYKKAA
ncbi:hypothetical protein HYY74_05615 [Candidatus Woesearchaeota archaeon]|nr:hypothetical protein [Candidatus Woesearchaeota archaeon]